MTKDKNIPDTPTYNPGCGDMEEPSLSVITLRCKCTCVLGSECWVAACSAVVVCPLGVYSSGSPKWELCHHANC